VKLKTYIAASAATLILGIIAGLETTTPTQEARQLIEPLRELAKQYMPYTIQTVTLIFTKNLVAVMVMWLSGILLTIPTIASLALNGYIIGIVMALTGNPVKALIAILPHGVIELPAVTIAGACGLRMGVEAARKIASIITHGKASMTKAFKETIKPMIISITLLIPAAIIEVYVTPTLIAIFK
jgi:stage II sporulation protein M